MNHSKINMTRFLFKNKTFFVLSLLFVSTFADEESSFPFNIFDSDSDPADDETIKEPNVVMHAAADQTSDGGGGIKKSKGVPDIPTEYKGGWELFSENSGVSAMHSILLPNNKVVMYDATIWEISAMKLPPGMPCRKVERNKDMDCWCHAIMFDIETGEKIPLTLQLDTWCSSGALDVDGNLVGTGGDKTGSRTVRYLKACDKCNWKEDKDALAEPRWYATTVTMGDGSFAIFGGRGMFSYEFIPPEGQYNKKVFNFPFLKETFDPVENNLYPFIHLASDGNLFIFANNQSILFDAKNNKVVRRYPVLLGGARNYPSSGMSVILPIRLFAVEKRTVVPTEVLVCGGSTHDGYKKAEKNQYVPALDDCARMTITSAQAKWKTEKMPSARVLGDMMILPTGDILMLNGAKRGTAAWGYAKEPNFNPVLYKPKAKRHKRFDVLTASNIPRMYHSSSTVLPDARVLVAGSNTNNGYLYNVEFPTELRVEKFAPPYLDPALAKYRPEIVVDASETKVKFGSGFKVQIKLTPAEQLVGKGDIKVSIWSPAFTTHGISMNQRLVLLGVSEINPGPAGIYNINVVAPPNGNIAPHGYYLLYVVYRGIPSKAVWVQFK